jgi:hypothetical protein
MVIIGVPFVRAFFETEILGNMNYNLSSQNICNAAGAESILLTTAEGKVYGYCHNSGVKIEIAGEAENTEGVYYTVSTYIGWSGGFINNILSLDNKSNSEDSIRGYWKISGQTRLIVNEN